MFSDSFAPENTNEFELIGEDPRLELPQILVTQDRTNVPDTNSSSGIPLKRSIGQSINLEVDDDLILMDFPSKLPKLGTTTH